MILIIRHRGRAFRGRLPRAQQYDRPTGRVAAAAAIVTGKRPTSSHQPTDSSRGESNNLKRAWQ